jgi:DNA-binding MarR family transcriptional regulator
MEMIMVSMEINTRIRAPLPGLESHLGYWLRRVSNSVSAAFARSLQARQTSVAEWVLLRQLYERGESAPGELAEALMMTRGAISKIVDKLEAKGWIASRVKPDDNRVQLLTLTRRGRNVLPELWEIADRNDEAFFGCLDASERTTLRQLLGKLAKCHAIREVPVE